MAIDLNDDILQDFLVEAGEIIEELGEQLVSLERTPEDKELLNAIFRGFHTVKGGAGFLSIEPLVEVCHRAEDVFNILRQGNRIVDQKIMDHILKVHDALGEMFSDIQQGNDPSPASRELIEHLSAYASSEVAQDAVKEDPLPDESSQEASPPESIDMTARSSDDDITDEEFEALLDQLHGEGKTVSTDAATKAEPVASANDNEITEEEFENLLDRLQAGEDKPAPADEADMSPAVAAQQIPDNHREKAVEEPAALQAHDDHKDEEKTAESNKAIKEKSQQAHPESTVRVDTKRLDDIMNLVGELVLVRNRLATIGASSVNEEMSLAVGNLDLVTSDLQTAVMKTRMQPIKKVFGRFPRVIRDLSRSLNKEVNLELIGEETDLDKNLVEALADPLVHLVRNAVDHGIEMPDVREKSGKPRTGTVILAAQQEGDHILLTISDDGAGMDADKLREVAIQRGVIDREIASRLSNNECYNLIFMPGFSTKDEISDISGRGVGMDVVKTKITQLNGMLNIDSELGKGSKIAIKVPLTLAIMPTLMVILDTQVFALPLGSVVEIFHLDLSKTKVIDGQEVVLIRNKALPIYYLRNWLISKKQDYAQTDGHVVVVNASGQNVGFVVDRLLGQEEVVIKPLGALLNGTMGLAGATITGNGKISLILDVPSLISAYANRM